ncbi:MAG: hypothetical protein H0U74_14000 [Bradymonadaceae bacterium]|nr:hypothetical protein [Lujinxingiaceae bacterium]
MGETFLSDLLLINADNDAVGLRTRLARFRGPDDFVEVLIPSTVCLDGSKTCVYRDYAEFHGGLTALLKLSGGKYLGIYSVNDDHERHTVLKYYALVVNPQERPIADIPPSPRTDIFLGCQTPPPQATPFEGTLAQMAACPVRVGGFGPHPTSPGEELGPVVSWHILVEAWFRAPAAARAEVTTRFEDEGCAAFELTLDLYPPGFPFATGTEDGCTGSQIGAPTSCEGDILKSCSAAVDCAALGVQCAFEFVNYCGPKSECNIGGTAKRLCQGEFLFYEVFGAFRTLDCSELGMTCSERPFGDCVVP